MNILGFLNALKIPDFWQLTLGFLSAIGAVYLIEYLRTPEVTIKKIEPLILQRDGRKFLKINVSLSGGNFFKRIFPKKDAASIAKIKAYILSPYKDKEVILNTYTIKWDTRPEPVDYNSGKLRLELLPETSAPENMVVGDEISASVVTKHPGEKGFYIFDGNYYVNQSANIVDRKIVKLRLVFSSSSITKQKEFIIINEGKTTENFRLEEI